METSSSHELPHKHFVADKEISPEAEKYASHVLLHLERHGEKEGDVLSESGKKQLYEKGKARGRAEHTAVAIGGPLERAQQSAALDMAGAEGTPNVTGEESFEVLKQKLDAAAGRKVGTRVGVDPRLGFDVGGPEFKPPLVKAFGEKKGLKFLVEQSDELAKKYNDENGLTYSRAAGNVAKVIQKYMIAAENFHTILADPEKLKQYGDTLERFLGSHAGVVDSFLAKVIEKTKGMPERDKFVEAMGHGAGFDTAEGFDIKIDTLPDSKEPQVRVEYAKKDPDGKTLYELNEVLSAELLQEIVKEGNILEKASEAA